MARGIHKLTTAKVRNAKPGLHSDGGCLYLQSTVGKEGNVRRSWIFRYELDGRRRDMGLGSLDTFSLAEARDRAREYRQLITRGVDPIDHRNSQVAETSAAAASAMTFDQCVTAYIETQRAGWRNPKHAAQWESTLGTYASPLLGALPVSAIDTAHVTKCLKPIWNEKTETAKRVRGRIEAVLDWARVAGYRNGDNPARWRGHLDKIFPKPSKVRKIKHYAALPYQKVETFLSDLRDRQSIGSLAFEFTILTVARTGEVRHATWDEFDLKNQVWIVPADRMKAGREHRVPLSDAAMAVLHKVREITRKIGGDVGHSEFVFPNDRDGDRLSGNVFLATLDRMDQRDITPHGFRSSFRDWAAEQTNYPNHVVEMALAHSIDDKTEAAYRRGELFNKRRRLMVDWAKFCAMRSDKTGRVIPMRKG